MILPISPSGNLTDELFFSREHGKQRNKFPLEVFQYFVGSSGNKNRVHMDLSGNEICDSPGSLGVRARGVELPSAVQRPLQRAATRVAAALLLLLALA